MPTETCGTAGGVNPPPPLPKPIDTIFELKLAAAKSCLPSPLKSPIAIDLGLLLNPSSTSPWRGDVKPPVPSPSRIDTFEETELAVAKSCLPSLLKSAIAIERGLPSTSTDGIAGGVNPPLPSPNRIETLTEAESAVAKSASPSLLKSAIEIEKGPLSTCTSGTAGDVNPPLPSPNRIETYPNAKPVVAISCLPSLLKSATATDLGKAPTPTSGTAGEVKPPLPAPKRIDTFDDA